MESIIPSKEIIQSKLKLVKKIIDEISLEIEKDDIFTEVIQTEDYKKENKFPESEKTLIANNHKKTVKELVQESNQKSKSDTGYIDYYDPNSRPEFHI